MEYSGILIKQLGIMFITVFLGFVAKKKKFYGDEFVKDLGNLLLYIINPLNMFQAFVCEYSSEKAKNLLLCLAISVIIFLINVAFVRPVLKKDEYCVEHFASVINNCGFFGLPIVQALFGNAIVFYATPYIVVNTISQYVYGNVVLSNDRNEVSFKKIIKNTSVISFVFGMVFFFLKIPFPAIALTTFQTLGLLMGPLCALIIGSNLAGCQFQDLFKDKMAPFVYFVRLILMPFVTIVLLKFFPNLDYSIKFMMVILLSTPSGSSTTVFSRNYNKDYGKAARIVSVCSLLTIVTIPLMTSLIDYFW